MTMTKMTKIEMYEQILTHLTDADEIAFIQHEIELTAKKNASRSTKPTVRQVENIAVAEKVLNAMETGHAYRVSEIGELKDLSKKIGKRGCQHPFPMLYLNQKGG